MPRERDTEIGRLIVERGLITDRQLGEAMAELQARLDASENPSSDSLSLVAILLDKGYVKSADLTFLVRRHDAADGSGELDGAPLPPPEALEAAKFPDSRFGKYTIIKLIAAGGMGAVYRAWDNDLKRIVALKFLTDTSEESVKRFSREAQTAARLNHPNIAQTYDVGCINNRHFIAMEYIEGVTLDTLPESVRKGDLAKIVRLMRDVAHAVEYAHSKGIIHRDLKPQNIMVDEFLAPHIMDFGLARAVTLDGLAEPGGRRRPVTVSGTIVGTPNYLSPEQARGDLERIGPRSDVYSLGATLYALATGGPPFAGDTGMDTILAVLQQEAPAPTLLNPSVPRELETVILRAIEKEPSARYASAKELGDDLERILNREPILARRAGAYARIRAFVRRRPLIAGAMVVAAVYLATAAATFALILQQEAEGQRIEEQHQAALVAQRQAAIRRRNAEIEVDAGRPLMTRAELLFLQPDFRPEELRSLATKAEFHLNRACAADPGFGEAFLLRARARLLLRSPRRALRDFDEAIRILGRRPALIEERGRLHLDLATRHERLALFLRSGTTPFDNRPSPDAAAHRTAAAADFGDLPLAPPADLNRREGLLDLASGRWSKGADRLAPVADRDADLHFWVAIASAIGGRPADADAALRFSLQCRPNYAEALALQGLLALQAGRTSDANERLLRAESVDPGLPAVHLLRAAMKAAAGDAEGARAACLEASRRLEAEAQESR